MKSAYLRAAVVDLGLDPHIVLHVSQARVGGFRSTLPCRSSLPQQFGGSGSRNRLLTLLAIGSRGFLWTEVTDAYAKFVRSNWEVVIASRAAGLLLHPPQLGSSGGSMVHMVGGVSYLYGASVNGVRSVVEIAPYSFKSSVWRGGVRHEREWEHTVIYNKSCDRGPPPEGAPLAFGHGMVVRLKVSVLYLF
ncbi:hypothetical protein EVAR_76728_1 [Eumeta japonica]|uniref:Uncharacterized protein n=1 Tax=Eumeta variegata TaxID=151549 RepID=A0A4C1SVP3_EUMVA|nr:hypothetical protein EVAR_76728_1 [Eumeta japonica]